MAFDDSCAAVRDRQYEADDNRVRLMDLCGFTPSNHCLLAADYSAGVGLLVSADGLANSPPTTASSLQEV